MNRKIETAIISVTDKIGVGEFAHHLMDWEVKIFSTGGTAKVLREGGVPVIEISDYTGFPEIMDGRVKTLHPKIHGGLLGLRDNFDHVYSMGEHGIKPIDMIVVNLYQFEKTVARKDVTLADAIENIDIGGPAMLRSAAKNFKFVTVIVDPTDYNRVLVDMKESKGSTSLATRFYLAKKVFRLTHKYDRAISQYLESISLEESAP